MKKSVLMFSLLSGTALMFPRLTIASGFPTHAHTYTPEPKPAFQFEQPDKAYQTAAVCFLGAGDCDSNVGFDKGDDYVRSGKEICMENGYEQTVCTVPSYLYNQCPEDSNYYQSCKEDRPRACREAGYVNSCDDGYIPDNSQSCPYDSSYQKCKCNPCDGYDYTLEEANAEGYEAGAVCNSCGTMKYQRHDAACNGFLHCDCGGEIGAQSCKSGTTEMFSVCQSCEPPCDENCPDGYYENLSCSFGSSSAKNECGTKTCYKCSAPNPNPSSYGCWKDCPEGYSYDENTHKYVCNTRTCENLIYAKYPSYVSGSSSQNDYTAGVTNMDEACYCYSVNDTVPLINSDILSPVDFADEFSACEHYCRPSAIIENTTIEGDVTLTYYTPNTYSGYGFSSNITVKGNLKSYLSHVRGLSLSKGSSALFMPKRCPEFENVVMFADSKLSVDSNCVTVPISGLTMYTGAVMEGIDSISGSVPIIGTTEDKPVKISAEKISGTITSSYYEEGNDGGLYLDFTDSLPNLTNVTINRNPVGKITLNPSSYTQASSGYYCASLFSNPGPDTHVYIQRTHANDSEHGSCIYFNGRILATEGKNSAELTFKEGVSSYVLPRCCSEDDGCPESIWNGSVKCTGKAKCYVSDDYKLPLNSSDRTECSD